MSYTNYHIIHTIAAPYVKVINLEKTCSVKRIKACATDSFLVYLLNSSFDKIHEMTVEN